MAIYTNIVCDICGNSIASGSAQHVNAQVYGVDFHLSCLTDDMFIIMAILGLDDIKVSDNDKLIYTSSVKKLITSFLKRNTK